MTLYLITDIETDGPEPSENSMLSLATVACAPGRGIVETVTVNLAPQAGHATHPETVTGWRRDRPGRRVGPESGEARG